MVRHRPLQRHRAADRVDHRAELDDGPVAHQLDDAALVLGEQRVDRGLAQVLDRRQRAGLVLLDQPRVADNVGRQNGGEAPLDSPFGRHVRGAAIFARSASHSGRRRGEAMPASSSADAQRRMPAFLIPARVLA